jgi:mono/diheme cytochrome c family protein
MNTLFDILHPKPLSDAWLQGLLFSSFTLHMVFVLLTIGSAVLAVSYFINAHWGVRPHAVRLDKRILKTFMVHKSLAVVLGVAPLLLIQVGFTVPFFTGVNILAPYWMLLVVILVITFLLFDAMEHALQNHRYAYLAAGIVALVLLLAVPALFTAVLVIAENSVAWQAIIGQGYKLSGALAHYWLFRYLHVLGAALVFGALFHYFFSAQDEAEKRSLLAWVIAGLVLQIVLGIMLYSALEQRPDMVALLALLVGAVSTAFLAWFMYAGMMRGKTLLIRTVLPVLMLVLVPMLVTRQVAQDRSLMPLEKQLRENALSYKKELQPYAQETLSRYQSGQGIVYDTGKTIYDRSCAFCHGAKANGAGPEAINLAIPPEDIASIRTTRRHLYTLLVEGVPGSAMPYFAVYDKQKLNHLIDYLNDQHGVLRIPEPVTANVSAAAYQHARKLFEATCSQCHGTDGRGSQLSKSFQPPPPDFTVYTLSPARTFDAITKGYPGTAMPSFVNLSPDVRWGLVKVIFQKRTI